MAIKMTKGDTLSLTVTNIEYNHHSYNGKSGTKYVHLIHLKDKNGNEDAKEYITETPEMPQDVFYVGIPQLIRCKYNNAKSDEIIPWDEEVQKMQTARDIAAGKPQAPGINQDRPHTSGVKISGESITFCFAYAKDLKVAEISRQPEGYRITDEDIEWIIKTANKLDGAIIEKITF